jgi:hypothetical protein
VLDLRRLPLGDVRGSRGSEAFKGDPVTAEQLLGQPCIVQRPDSPGFGRHARIDRVDPRLPFPVHASWGPGEAGGAWFLLVELEPSQVML